ncbi:hypothetical protein Kpho02_69680 [Kitasatospora phosalacinea]|uniref:Uncharacterized protein n=1 Tax=Kitasatospora phosalacinea TaxID=2065 RepID=A0A9W6QCL9_9ACTN|nr:hypothetical protein Kpho02_69680 [Kitasatospora phosalacinea]
MLFLDEDDLVATSQQGCDDLDARAGDRRGGRGGGGGFGCGHGSLRFVSQGFDAAGDMGGVAAVPVQEVREADYQAVEGEALL